MRDQAEGTNAGGAHLKSQVLLVESFTCDSFIHVTTSYFKNTIFSIDFLLCVFYFVFSTLHFFFTMISIENDIRAVLGTKPEMSFAQFEKEFLKLTFEELPIEYCSVDKIKEKMSPTQVKIVK